MRVLITGCNGQLGQALSATAPGNAEIQGVDLPDVDIADAAAVEEAVTAAAPEVIVNAAAYTAVDAAEDDADRAFQANAQGTLHLAQRAHQTGARLIHISTDYVFDGRKSSPYLPDDDTGPLNVYGRSKLEGERHVQAALSGRGIILRTSWLYSSTGDNFVTSMLRLLTERDEVSVIADQLGSPTWAESLAATVWAAAANPALSGIYHWTDAGVASWYDFANAIQREASSLGLLTRSVPILPITTEQYPTPAQRPMYSVLDKTATYQALALRPIHWQLNLRNMLQGMIR